MPLVEELSPLVESALKTQRNGSSDLPLTVAIKADLAPDGTLGERWVIADEKDIRVLGPAGEAQLTLAIAGLSGAQTEQLVGGGALFVQRGSDRIELTRFTTPLAGNMAGVARALDAVAKGKELPDAGLDDIEKKCPTCGRALPKDSEVCRFCFDKRATFFRLLSYAAPYKFYAVVLTALMFAGTAAGLAPGYIIKLLTDDALAPTRPLSDASRLNSLGIWVAGLILASIVGLGLGIWRGRLAAYLSANITLSIRTQLYEKMQKLGLSFYDKRQTGTLLTRVTQDVNELNNFLVDGLQILVVNGLTLIGVLAILLAQNWKLTLLVLIPVPLAIFATTRIWKYLFGRLERVWHLRSSLAAGLNATLNGARVVKAFAQEDREVNRFHKRVHSLFRANLDLENWWATLLPILGFVMGAGGFVVWYIGGRQVVAKSITLGTFQMFFFYLGQLYGPLQGMTRIADWLGRALTSAERVFEVMDTEPDIADVIEPVPMPVIQGGVTFKNVGFSYDKARRILDDISFDVKPGEMIGLVGHSGAGKTTIINLLSRFYDPIEGEILIDGVPMKNIKLDDLRRQFGIVLQEPFLFPGTIGENIAYAKPEASRVEIMKAGKAANAHEFILRFPDGYDTQVGERGVRLSGGERQRISIARAILHDPRILILDEATASVDTETEKQIQEAIQRLIKNRTTFAIAHRLSTLRNADRLLVIEKGKLTEMGTHDELMANDTGTFKKLVDMQTAVNKLKTAEETESE
jgi:ATP-binding cassette, subfamily B, bacterial